MMSRRVIKYLKLLLISVLLSNLMISPARAALSPSAVGWGNLFVPGLGATLRDHPVQGFTEAITEIGTYYGGTFGTHEGEFTIDGSVNIPTRGSVFKAVTGQVLQEFGLKYHFFNTFYHYQQASLNVANTETEQRKEQLQPLYKGSWKDMLKAPFSWDTLSSVWVFPLILASTAYIIYDYHTTPVQRVPIHASPRSELLYGTSQVAVIPFGGLFGEEPLFRGFIQREAHYASGSLVAGIATESVLFTAIHPVKLMPTAFLSGIYFGILTHHFHGDLAPSMAAHFWVNVASGAVSYFLFRAARGKSAPFVAKVEIPF